MKLYTAFALLAFTASTQAAAILANRIVITSNNAAGDNAFHIAEIQVFQQGSATNVAASANGGTAIASSSGWGTAPSYAIDGNTSGGFGSNSVWHNGTPDDTPAQFDPNATISVTFSAPFVVDSYTIYGRDDCCAARDDSFNVQFFNGATLVSEQLNVGILVGNSMSGVPVPEPAVSLSGLLALGLLSLRRRRA